MTESTLTTILILDAVRLSQIATVDRHKLLPYVMYMPLACPGWCEEPYVLMASAPIASEFNAETAGQQHLRCLESSLHSFCTEGSIPLHLRTDGKKVWTP